MARRWTGWLPASLTVGLLGAVAWCDRLSIDLASAEPFHARCQRAVNVPMEVMTDAGVWHGKDLPLDEGAAELLKPGIYVSRLYLRDSGRRVVQLLIVQCKDARAMVGHYPQNCYSAQGCEIVGADPQTWQVGPVNIPGVEYRIMRPMSQGEGTTAKAVSVPFFVRDFFVLPDGRLTGDMQQVIAAAGQYGQLAYGVAQIQFACDSEFSPRQRDELFARFMEPNLDLIRAMQSGLPPGR